MPKHTKGWLCSLYYICLIKILKDDCVLHILFVQFSLEYKLELIFLKQLKKLRLTRQIMYLQGAWGSGRFSHCTFSKCLHCLELLSNKAG